MLNHPTSIDHYFDTLGRWLDLEGEAERARMARRRQLRRQTDAEKTGETLVRMRMADHQTGLAGRWLLDHTAAIRPELLPHFVRLVDKVEQNLGLHRRRRSQVLPTEPALVQAPMSAVYDAEMSVPLAV